MAKRYFTLSVVLMLASMAFGQASKGDVDGSGSPHSDVTVDIMGSEEGRFAAQGLELGVIKELPLSSPVQGLSGAYAPSPEVNIPGNGIMHGIENIWNNFVKDEVLAWHQNYNSNQVAAGIDNAGRRIQWMAAHPLESTMILGMGGEGGGIGKFGPNDLLLGVREYESEFRELGEGGYHFRERLVDDYYAGRQLTDLRELMHNLPPGAKIRFYLKGINMKEVFDVNAKHYMSFTSIEMRYIRALWGEAFNSDNVLFYPPDSNVPMNGVPWEK